MKIKLSALPGAKQRQGLKVLEIGTPEECTINMNLEELYRLHGGR